MANWKKLAQGAAGAGGGEVLNVEDVFSTYLYTGNGKGKAINNGIALGNGPDGTEGSSTFFDGSGDHITKSSDLTGNSDGKTFTFSFWIKPTPNNTNDMRIYHTSGSWKNEIKYSTSSGRLFVAFFANESSGGTVFEIQNPDRRMVEDAWNHVIFSADMTDTSKRHLYINDLAAQPSYTFNNQTIDFTRSTHAIGDDLTSSTGDYRGYMAHFYFDKTYRDLSVESNRRTFINANLGSSSEATLSALNPIVYLPMTTGYSVGENEGTGGDFSTSGTPTIVSGGPEASEAVGQGGMTWIKLRNSASNNELYDTERGATYSICTNITNAAITRTTGLTSFNSNGFTLGSGTNVNANNYDVASWTFRKAPKFFDVVTYTGNGSPRTIAHNLGTTPGCIMVKNLSDSSTDWAVYHRGLGAGFYLKLNSADAQISATSGSAAKFNNTAPTSSVFSVGTNNYETNLSGSNYVAYLFAHHDGDGTFGLTGNQDIIHCGSYSGNGNNTTGKFIDLGFEPQWLLIRRLENYSDWHMFDTMRGISNASGGVKELIANGSNAESNTTLKALINPNGFTVSQSQTNGSGSNYVFIAIRRGPMAVPTSGTDVFKVDAEDSGSYNNPPLYVSDFPVDFALRKQTNNSSSWIAAARLSGDKTLKTNARDVETTTTASQFDYNNGWFDDAGWNAAIYSWMWRRAPNFFDVITWKVDGTGDQTINHNLGVVPEMIWTKNRDDSGSGSGDWWIAHKDMTGWDSASQNDRHAFQGFAYNSSAQQGYHRDFSSTSIRLLANAAGGYVTGHDCIGYLFASLDGVSKVGSFTGNGSSQTIDCGFSNGARFILIKRTDSGSSWTTYDTVRGIVSGADGYLALNSTSQQLTYDDIDPHSSGFIVNGPSVSGTSGQVNVSGASYIFYAVA